MAATGRWGETILGMPIEILFDFVAVHIHGEKAADADIHLNLDFTDSDEQWNAWITRGVLNARRGHSDESKAMVPGPRRHWSAFCSRRPQPPNSRLDTRS